MKKKLHIGNEIRKELNNQDRSIAWLAKNIDGCDSSNLGKQLKSPHIRTELLNKICIILKKDFFLLFSQQLSEVETGR